MTDYSDTPAGIIARLDDALSRRGEDITLLRSVKRSGSAVDVDVTVRAVVRTTTGDAILGSLTQETMRVIISPTQILAAGWPGSNDAEPGTSTTAAYLPRAQDIVIIRGKRKTVKFPGEVYVGGTWVRCDMVVEG